MDNYYTPESKIKKVSYSDELGTVQRSVCLDCLKHEQGDVDEVVDCKNLFVDKNGKVIGQCCCYSKEHGYRDKWEYYKDEEGNLRSRKIIRRKDEDANSS